MLSRQAFDRRRAAVRELNRREGRRLAAVSVILGIAQLLFLRWADGSLPGTMRRALALSLFLAYMALLGALLWRLQHHLRQAAPTCPECGVLLQGASERVAAATGRCDSCGGRVIADGPLEDGSGPPGAVSGLPEDRHDC